MERNLSIRRRKLSHSKSCKPKKKKINVSTQLDILPIIGTSSTRSETKIKCFYRPIINDWIPQVRDTSIFISQYEVFSVTIFFDWTLVLMRREEKMVFKCNSTSCPITLNYLIWSFSNFSSVSIFFINTAVKWLKIRWKWAHLSGHSSPFSSLYISKLRNTSARIKSILWLTANGVTREIEYVQKKKSNKSGEKTQKKLS